MRTEFGLFEVCCGIKSRSGGTIWGCGRSGELCVIMAGTWMWSLLFVGSWDVQLLSKPLDGLILVQVLDAFGWIMFLVEGMSQLSGTANMMDGESITVLTNRMLE